MNTVRYVKPKTQDEADAHREWLNGMAVFAKTDEAAMVTVLEVTARLQYVAIRRYARRSLGTALMPCLYQQARMAVLRAVKVYDPTRGTAFVTCVWYWFMAYLRRYQKQYLGVVAVGHEPGSSGKRGKVLWPVTISIDSGTRAGIDNEHDEHWSNILADDHDLEDEFAEEHRETACKSLAVKLLGFGAVASVLSEREVAVLCYRFANGSTLEQTAVDFGLTRERIRQIEGAAINKLRDLINGSLTKKERQAKYKDQDVPWEGESFDEWLGRVAEALKKVSVKPRRAA